MYKVNEQTTCVVKCKFYDVNGAEVTPTSVTYKLDDAEGTAIIASTTVTPSTSEYSITISSSLNVIINNDLKYETKILTVSFIYGGGIKETSQIKYALVNLDKI